MKTLNIYNSCLLCKVVLDEVEIRNGMILNKKKERDPRPLSF